MKIENIQTIKLRFPLEKPIINSFGEMKERTNLLIKIETDEGITGIGETFTNWPHWAAEEREITIEKGLKPLIIGKNPLEISKIWEKMYESLITSGAGLQWGARGLLFQAMSGVDIALWDIAGKKYDLPVYRMLGGPITEKIPAYASGLGPEDFEDIVLEHLERGFEAFKLKVGFGEEKDLKNVKKMREMIGPDNLLLIDANQGWENHREAIRILSNFKEYNPRLIEEPIKADDHYGLKKIQQNNISPVAGGENVYSRYGFKEVFEKGFLDIIQPDLTKTGGLSEANVICKMAKSWEIPYAPHMFGTVVGQAASINLLAAVPDGLFMEIDANENPLLQDLAEDKFYEFEEGKIKITKDKPGLGIDLDKKILQKHSS